jgi:hypothetical protein
MRSATLFVLFGAVIAANGCGSSSNGTGTAGTGGGTAGIGGGTAGIGGNAGGHAGGTAGAGGTTGNGGAGGSPAACGAETGAGTGATCSTAAATGACVTEVVVAGTAPTPGGGPVSQGTYNLTSASIYNAPDGSAQFASTGRRTLVVGPVTAGSFTLDQISVSGTRTDRSSGTVVVTGTTATFTRLCPPPGDAGNPGGTVGYTATSTSITLIDSSAGDGSIEVTVYTK